MDKEDRPALTGEAQTSYLLRREAARKAAASGSSSSPLAVEATLASIAAEVTADALERYNRARR
jgi:hypothetical protein